MNKFFLLAGSILFLILIYSVVLSGYHYQLDNDEVFHVNVLYQLYHGARPYTSFFTIYTPIFHWLLLPFFFVFGPTFTTFHVLRALMIVIFALRVILTAVLVRRIFEPLTAYIFVVLMLLDPFAVFSAMQIRPDNVMLCMVVAGFLLLQYALQSKNTKYLFGSGVFFGLAVITIIKSVPLVMVTSGMLAIWQVAKKQTKQLMIFLWGILLPVAAFLLFYAALGELRVMIRGVLFDPLILFQSLLYKTSFRFFYQPGNIFIYGSPGKTLSWYYTISLPYMALLGIGWSFWDMWKKKRVHILPAIIAVGLLTGGFILYKSPVVFIQYFLSVNWIMALFGAVALVFVYRQIAKRNIGKVLAGAGMFLFLVMTISSTRANIARATINQTSLEESFTRLWNIIPQNEPTFPNMLFRPAVYPLLIGSFYGDVPPSILARFGDIAQILETRKVQYLILSDYYMSFFPPHVQEYVKNNYTKTSTPEVYRRRE